MVVRRQQRDRKYQGTRRWGVGNIKNARGKGDTGGTGSVNRLRKHDWTYITAKRRDLIRGKGFTTTAKFRMKEITLIKINEMAKQQNKTEFEFEHYKVLSNGALEKPMTIKASAFSALAKEKITGSGGKAILFEVKKIPVKAAEEKAKA